MLSSNSLRPTEGLGSLSWFMQVLAVGIILDSLSTSTNFIDGCSANPSAGSSSVPVTDLRICPKETAPLLQPIEIMEINQFLGNLLLNIQMQKTTYVLNLY